MNDHGRMWRSLILGALLGVFAVAALAVWMVQASRKATEAPRDMLVIALTEDQDGAVVAGIIFATEDPDDGVTFVDPDAEVAIPGTSYDRVKDAYAFGGGSAVMEAVGELPRDSGLSRTPEAWVVLPDDTWQALVDARGGAEIDIPSDINAFLRGDLHMFSAGRREVNGEDLVVLAGSIDFVESARDARDLRAQVNEAVADTVADSWEDIADAVADGRASSSVTAQALQSFAQEGEVRQ